MPVFCTIGGFSVYSYGVLSAAALVVAAVLAAKRAKTFGFEPARAVDAVFLLFIAGMAGSRLFFVFQHLELYRDSPLRAFDFREGGLVWYGGFLLAFGAAFWIVDAFKWKRWAFADFIPPVLAAGHAVGRIGCWLNGCCGGVNGVPIQLIEAVFLGGLAVFLSKKTGRLPREGDVFLLYVLLYSAGRFVLEFWRDGQTHYSIFTIPQITGAVLFALAAGAWTVRHGSRNV